MVNVLSENTLIPWQAASPIPVPNSALTVESLASHAKLLKGSDVQRVVQAFNAGLFDLGFEYVWTRAMATLKQQLATLGMRFVGEMLNRPDIGDDSTIELVITDYDALTLASQLGIITSTGALELKQNAELIAHFLRSDLEPEDQLHPLAAMNALRVSIQHILGREKIEVSMDFAHFRRSLTQTVFTPDDEPIHKLVLAPYFFRRTAIRLILADAKEAKGAQAENALGNLNIILPLTWSQLQDGDRWQVGEAYAEATAAGQGFLASQIKTALLKVRGFDYVPETLRSTTYKVAAAAVLDAHHGMNNFYREAEPMIALANLGSTIPGPAFSSCMQAVLSIKLGNMYGHTWKAQDPAERLLKQLTSDQWRVYLTRFLPTDDVILPKLTQTRPISRWKDLLREFGLVQSTTTDAKVSRLIEASLRDNDLMVSRLAAEMFSDLSG